MDCIHHSYYILYLQLIQFLLFDWKEKSNQREYNYQYKEKTLPNKKTADKHMKAYN